MESASAQVYPTKDYESFEDALQALYSEEMVRAHPPRSAALACAGPVIDNRCQMTNLTWLIDGHELTAVHNILWVTIIGNLLMNSLLWIEHQCRCPELCNHNCLPRAQAEVQRKESPLHCVPVLECPKYVRRGS